MEEIRARLRVDAAAAFAAGVAAADPGEATRAALARRPLAPPPGRLLIAAIGKAARAMAAAAQAAVPAGVRAETLIVTNYENADGAGPVDGRLFAAGHPTPDENGQRAAAALMAALRALGSGDAALALVSGGASALVPAPAHGLSLADKIAVNDLMLAGGLDIVSMNLVRQNLSELKGGGALRLAAPAPVRSLILSDVLGDDLRVVASGPTVGPIGDAAAARAVLSGAGLWETLPEAARRALSRQGSARQDASGPDASGPDARPTPPAADAELVGGNSQSVAAMAAAAGASPAPDALEGDVADAAERLARWALEAGPGARLAFGGETTVTVTGGGKGGRNQELALRTARAAERIGLSGPWCFLSGGTDGRDGPTEAAGGLVDDGTLARLAGAGVSLDAALAQNDSFPALAAAQDLLVTGATGTNVADLQLFLRG